MVFYLNKNFIVTQLNTVHLNNISQIYFHNNLSICSSIITSKYPTGFSLDFSESVFSLSISFYVCVGLSIHPVSLGLLIPVRSYCPYPETALTEKPLVLLYFPQDMHTELFIQLHEMLLKTRRFIFVVKGI